MRMRLRLRPGANRVMATLAALSFVPQLGLRRMRNHFGYGRALQPRRNPPRLRDVMMPQRRALVSILGSLAVLLNAAAVAAQADQSAIAKRLHAPDAADRVSALAQADALRPQEVGPVLRTALIEALAEQGDLLSERERALRIGQAVPPMDEIQDPEYVLALQRVVIGLRDSLAIPALAATLGTGGRVTRALAAFGEQAAPSVVAVVTAQESSPYAIDDSLVALRFMLEGAADAPLSAPTLRAIRRAAELRLTEPARLAVTGGTLRRAIDLAIALDDTGLRGTVEELARSPAAVAARGVTDPQMVRTIQKHAAERLAGAPALPRCC
jgi:hypothetical protein